MVLSNVATNQDRTPFCGPASSNVALFFGLFGANHQPLSPVFLLALQEQPQHRLFTMGSGNHLNPMTPGRSLRNWDTGTSTRWAHGGTER